MSRATTHSLRNSAIPKGKEINPPLIHADEAVGAPLKTIREFLTERIVISFRGAVKTEPLQRNSIVF